MSTDLLHEVGSALYGPQWQSEMARCHGVADRTIRRWASGESPIPAGLWAELRADVKGRQGDLAKLLKRLPK